MFKIAAGKRCLLFFLQYIYSVDHVGARTREKAVSGVPANVDDSLWALNGDTVVLNCRHPATSGDIWSQRAPDGTESAAPGPVRVANVGSTLTASMSPSLNGTSYKCILTDFRGTRVFESGWIKLFLGGRSMIKTT